MATSSIRICEEHDNCECEYYCMNCNKNICQTCTLSGEHSGHDHCTIELAVIQGRDVMKVTGEKTDDMFKGLNERYEAMKAKLQHQGDYARNKIDEHYNELEHYLKEQKEQVTHQLNDTISKILAATLAQAKSDVLDMKEMKDALEKPVPSKSILCNFPGGNVSPSSELLMPSKIYLGETHTASLFIRGAEGKYCSKGGHQVSIHLETDTGNISILSVKDNGDGSYKTSFTTKEAGPAKLVVLINGLPINGSPHNITVCRKYKEINLPDIIVNNGDSMGRPCGVAVGRFGVWAIADNSNNCFYVYDDENQLLRTVGSKGSNNGEFIGPHGIALDNENYLYVVDGYNHRKQKFDINGDYLLQFGGQGKGNGQLNSPHGITVHNDRVYVADHANRRISVFQSDGQFHTCFGSGHLGGPYDVAVNRDNRLLAIDSINSYSSCCLAFTLDGHYIGKFADHSPQIYSSCCLATDINGFILVGQKIGFQQRVCIFDHVGNFISCFGSEGSAKGQFQGPVGIALASDGKIYVSDHKNKRVQIYVNY